MPGPYQSFKVGGVDEEGEKITYIIGRTDTFVVYLTEGDFLKFANVADVPSPREVQIFKVYDRLDSFISRSYRRNKAYPLKLDLGNALFAAVCDSHSTSDVTAYFADVEGQVAARVLNLSRAVYLISGLGVALVSAAALYFAYAYGVEDFSKVSQFALGLTGGIVGSALSIWMRSGTLAISAYTSFGFSAFQGISRIGLGAFFGFVLICCVKADLLLGTFSKNPYALFAFSIVAGFSETFVPELLRRLEAEANKPAAKQHK
jgi:hypothetical protein